EGDIVLSPSASLLISRVRGNNGVQAGYRLRSITPDGGGGVNIPQIASYCFDGAKPAISFDERWMVTHHYVEDTDADAQDLGFANRLDPGFTGYPNNSANIILVDLLSGDRTRVTRMGPGQFA